MKISKQTIISTVLLLVSIVNQILTAFGKSPLPIENETVVSIVSLVFLGVSSLIALKNGKGITTNSILSKKVCDALKKGYVSDEKVEEFLSEIEDAELSEDEEIIISEQNDSKEEGK